MDKKIGKVVCIKSYGHTEEQVVRHTRKVLGALGIGVYCMDFSPGAIPSIFDEIAVAEKARRRKLTVVEEAELWIDRKFGSDQSRIEALVKQGLFVLADGYMPVAAAALGQKAEKQGEVADGLEFAKQFCETCQNQGMIKVDAGVVIADPRLDNALIDYGNGQVLPVHRVGDYTGSFRRRDILLQLTDQQREWKHIQAGRLWLSKTDTGEPICPENNYFWREYHEIEMETIRHILPFDFEISDARMLELLDKIKFDR